MNWLIKIPVSIWNDFKKMFVTGIACAAVGSVILYVGTSDWPGWIGITGAVLLAVGGSFVVNGGLGMKGYGGWL